PNYLQTVYSDLGIHFPEVLGSSFVSPKNYSILFRVLYGATYLNRNDSEQLRNILTKTTYNDGITTGIPKLVTVAHKFGFRTLEEPDNSGSPEELHDCGIVYYPGHPFFLCVMTLGDNYQNLASAIGHVAKA